MKYHDKLDINWKMPSPPLKATQWFVWNRKFFESPPGKTLPELNFEPAPNPALINQALRRKLPRSTGWEAGPDLSPEQSQSLKATAQVYKRGVPFKVSGQKESPLIETNGHYPILWPKADNGTPLSPLLDVLKDEHTFVLADASLVDHHPELKPYAHYLFRSHEKEKTLQSALMVCSYWKKHHSSATSFTIIGGGVTSDLGAFASSLCGLPFTLIPGTLLAMADACVGGKTGVNAPPFGKNLLGKFAFPTRVLIFPDLLATLSDRDFKSGASECLKHALLDPKFSQREELARALSKRSAKQLETWLPEIMSLKANIVEEDPAEVHKRATLNLGHTLAHALEAVSHQNVPESKTIRHGEAVAVGLLFSVFMSWKLNFLSSAKTNSMIRLILNSEILLTPEKLSYHLSEKPSKTTLSETFLKDEIWSYICNDKKSSSSGNIHSFWILLKDFGEVARSESDSYTTLVCQDTFAQIWVEFIEQYLVFNWCDWAKI